MGPGDRRERSETTTSPETDEARGRAAGRASAARTCSSSRVPEAKTIKNRVHLDLTPDTTRDEEVARLEALGRRRSSTAATSRPDGAGWVVMPDPEGNEFCVERSDAERAG